VHITHSINKKQEKGAHNTFNQKETRKRCTQHIQLIRNKGKVQHSTHSTNKKQGKGATQTECSDSEGKILESGKWKIRSRQIQHHLSLTIISERLVWVA
jgi:hypothetical protein